MFWICILNEFNVSISCSVLKEKVRNGWSAETHRIHSFNIIYMEGS